LPDHPEGSLRVASEELKMQIFQAKVYSAED